MWQAATDLINKIFDHVTNDRVCNPDKSIIPKEVVRIDDLKYPDAKQSRGMSTRGQYRKGFPCGAVIHFTSGRYHNPQDAIALARKQGYCYFIIDRNGQVYQDFSLTEWGYHAGASTWKTYGPTVNDDFVGIELMCAGPVTPEVEHFSTWFKTKVDAEEVRFSESRANINKGYYHKFTEAQESALTELLSWMEMAGNGIFSFDNVVGHDEVSPKRKVDPGASLSMTMPEYREYLKNLI